MRNVLALAIIISTLASAAGRTAHADPLCPLGWVCEIAKEYRAGDTYYSDGNPAPICSLHHVVRTAGAKFEFHTISFARTTAPVSEFSFFVSFRVLGADGKHSSVPLRDLRIVSADRILDTKDWFQRADRFELHSVSQGGIVTDGPVARAALDIATGGIYGALVTTDAGAHLRFEIRGHRLTEAEKLAVRKFRECALEGRAPPPADADRG